MHHFTTRRIVSYLLLLALIATVFSFLYISYPPKGERQEIFLTQGTVPREFAAELERAGVVRYSSILRVVLKLRGTAGQLVPGTYLFEGKESVYKVASRITSGAFGTNQMKVTIPEGSTNVEIAALIKEKYPDFSAEDFLLKSRREQGYLFPETYYFLSTSTTEILSQLTDSFDFHVRELQSDALMDGKDWDEIVIMASILEEEADTAEDFKIISGILWKRLSIGMALQVDAAPVTYDRPGFPPGPLSNPGLVTLEAATYPTETDHLFYLTGRDGLMHYAATYEEHKRNIERYLR